MALQSCNSLMRYLGVEIGIPALALDEEHCCALDIDSVVLNFELDEPSGLLFLYTNLGPVPAFGASRLYERLLAANLMGQGTEGATLGLDREAQRLVLHRALRAQQLTDIEFKEAVEKFVDVAELWIQLVDWPRAAGRACSAT